MSGHSRAGPWPSGPRDEPFGGDDGPGGTSYVTAMLRLAFLLLALAPVAAPAVEPFVDFETGVAWAGMNDVRIPGDGGTEFSLTDDLEASAVPYYRVRLGAVLGGRHTVFAFYTPVRIVSRGTFSEDVVFEGVTFPAGSTVTATYRFDSPRLTYRYGLVRSPRWEVDVGVTAKVRDAEIALQGAQHAAKANTGFVPLLSFRAAWRLSPAVSLVLDGDALAASQGRAEDVSLAVEARLRDGVHARAGYRILEGGADNDEVYNFALVHFVGAGLTVRL